MTPSLPLDDVRVLDLTHYTAGPFCTRLLADYGADVVKIEPPGGDPARGLPPFAGDEPGIERSGLFLMLNTNKRSVVLDLKRPEGRERLLELARAADVLVENFSPGTLERLGLGYEQLAEANPRLVLTSITNFGQDGPYRDWQGTDLTLHAMGGPMLTTGDVDHEPIRLAGHWAGYQAGYIAALATTVALYGAERRGTGEHVDVSIFEVLSHSIEARLLQMLTYQFTGRLSTRSSQISGLGTGTYPCADGYFAFLGMLPGFTEPLFRMIGQGDLLQLPEWSAPGMVADPERIEAFDRYLLPWASERTKKDIRAACQQFGALGAPLNTIADLMEDENFVARQFFEEIDHPTTGPIAYPGYHFRLHSGEGMPPRRRAPLLGEHTAEVLNERADTAAPVPTPNLNLSTGLPLEGLRILDLTVIWAGPYGTMHLADWGADVIRIESRQHFARNTRGLRAKVTKENAPQEMAGGWYPDDEPGDHPWNRCALFGGHARGKRSMTLDLTRPEGQEVFEQLVAEADGLIENNLPANIERQGITWERLSKINPKLVLVRAPAFGLDGPYRDYRTLGDQMESVVGHPVIRAYPDLSLDYAPRGVPADTASGIGSAYAFMVGLRHRDRTGRGQLVELSTAENIVAMLGEFVMDYGMNGRLWEKMGNDHWFLAPHNVYRCIGDDCWVTIAVRNEDDWRALCRVIGRPDLLDDPRFTTMEARHTHRRELDPEIALWTAERDAHWVMRRLQREGVPSGVTLNAPGLLENPQHVARGFFQEIESPATGRQLYVDRAWKASKTPPHAMRHPPLLGEDNEYVYKQLLGFTDEQYRAFEESGHIGGDYDPSVA